MKKNIIILISKIVILIAVLLCGIAIILPWGVFSAGFLGGIEFYIWGAHTSSTTITPWVFYYSNFEWFNMIQNIEFESIKIAFALLYFVFPLTILSLIFGVFGFYRIDKKITIGMIFSIIFSFFAIALFVIFIQFGIFSIPNVNVLSPFFSYGAGFYFIIISIILMAIADLIVTAYYRGKLDNLFSKND